MAQSIGDFPSFFPFQAQAKTKDTGEDITNSSSDATTGPPDFVVIEVQTDLIGIPTDCHQVKELVTELFNSSSGRFFQDSSQILTKLVHKFRRTVHQARVEFYKQSVYSFYQEDVDASCDLGIKAYQNMTEAFYALRGTVLDAIGSKNSSAAFDIEEAVESFKRSLWNNSNYYLPNTQAGAAWTRKSVLWGTVHDGVKHRKSEV